MTPRESLEAAGWKPWNRRGWWESPDGNSLLVEPEALAQLARDEAKETSDGSNERLETTGNNDHQRDSRILSGSNRDGSDTSAPVATSVSASAARKEQDNADHSDIPPAYVGGMHSDVAAGDNHSIHPVWSQEIKRAPPGPVLTAESLWPEWRAKKGFSKGYYFGKQKNIFEFADFVASSSSAAPKWDENGILWWAGIGHISVFQRNQDVRKIEAERDALRDSRDRLQEALRESETVVDNLAAIARRWVEAFDVYWRAWLREIGGVIVPKHHEIDGFVLRTRAVYDKAKLVDRIKKILCDELKAKSDGEKMFDAVFKFLAEDGNDKTPTN